MHMRDAYTVQQAAHTLGIGPRALFATLRSHKLIDDRRVPYPRSREQGLMRVKYSHWTHPERGEQQSQRPMLTAKGIEHVRKLLEDERNEPF